MSSTCPCSVPSRAMRRRQISDIDVVVKLEDAIMQSGLGYIGALMDLKDRLEDITGKSVDIVSEPLRKERFRQNVERDRVVAF